MTTEGPVRRFLRALRRRLLPSFDLLLVRRARLLRRVDPHARVLDAGCGDGTIALRLARRGCRVVAVSNDRAQIARLAGPAAAQATFRVHDLARDGPVPSNTMPPLPRGEGRGEGASGFDAAVCFDVLEHILDDRAALANLAASLRPGGRLLLTVPDREAPPLWGDTLSSVEDGGHVRAGYTREELDALLRGAGLTPVRWSSFGGFFTRRAVSLNRRLERRPGALPLLLRLVGLVVLRPLCRLDAILPGRKCELFVVADRPPADASLA